MIQTGVSFDDIHSFYELNLVLSKVEISPAEPKINLLDIPGGDGSLDLTEVHGEVKYGDRTIKMTFTMLPQDRLTFEERKSAVANVLNGQRFKKITLDKDLDYYYQGRCVVDSTPEEKKIRQIIIIATVRPYKLKQKATVRTFSLTAAEQVVTLENERKTVIPSIECTNDNAVVVFNGNEHRLSAGTHRILDICLTAGDHELKLSGSGTIIFTYQEGAL